jgi:hypothetical protein
VPASDTDVGQFDEVSWADAIRIAKKNKLLPALARSDSARSAPGEAAAVLRKATMDVAAANSSVLVMVRTVCDALAKADFPFVIFKGPVQQRALHGDFFIKSAFDVDVLVANRDFDQARALLGSAGFALPPDCAGRWWRLFLGEQHLVRADASRLTVDLHHRVQQPGCPPPRATERFLASPLLLQVGNTTVPTLQLPEIALLSAMSIVKAIYNRQPTGSHAMDLSAAFGRMTEPQAADTVEEARRQGLLRTLAFACRAADVTFGAATPAFAEVPLADIDPRTLSRMVLSPDDPSIKWRKRRHFFRALADRPLIDVPVELAWLALSDLTRRFEQRRAGAPPADG